MLRGFVKDGSIIIPGGIDLPDGTRVRIEPANSTPAAKSVRSKTAAPKRKPVATKSSKPKSKSPKSFAALSKSLAGSIKDLPADASRNVDHYLYGHKRRSS